MSRRREVFHIEELSDRRASRIAVEPSAEAALRHAEIMTELRALREAIGPHGVRQPAAFLAAESGESKGGLGPIHEAVERTKQEIAALVLASFIDPDMGRVSQELKAAVRGSESATHCILQASEQIEEAAKLLAAAINNIQDQNLARDILDQVTNIIEACNFQDLAGQRITKVTATLQSVEEHIRNLMQIWGGFEQLLDVEPAAAPEVKKYAKLENGPKLEGDCGCLSQKEIDAMFAARC